MLAPIRSDPFRPFVQVKRIAIEMVVRRNEMYVFLPREEINQAMELPRQVDIIVLREIHDIRILLLEEDLHLLPKCRLVSDTI